MIQYQRALYRQRSLSLRMTPTMVIAWTGVVTAAPALGSALSGMSGLGAPVAIDDPGEAEMTP